MTNILYKLFKALHEKMQHYVYCNYSDISMIYINSNMALLKVRNHDMIIYNKVLNNRAILAHHKIPRAIKVF